MKDECWVFVRNMTSSPDFKSNTKQKLKLQRECKIRLGLKLYMKKKRMNTRCGLAVVAYCNAVAYVSALHLSSCVDGEKNITSESRKVVFFYSFLLENLIFSHSNVDIVHFSFEHLIFQKFFLWFLEAFTWFFFHLLQWQYSTFISQKPPSHHLQNYSTWLTDWTINWFCSWILPVSVWLCIVICVPIT